VDQQCSRSVGLDLPPALLAVSGEVIEGVGLEVIALGLYVLELGAHEGPDGAAAAGHGTCVLPSRRSDGQRSAAGLLYTREAITHISHLVRETRTCISSKKSY
jgi:hypothetical protein